MHLWGGAPASPHIARFTLDESPDALVKVFGGVPPNVVRHQTWTVLQFHGEKEHAQHHSCDGAFEYEFFLDGMTGKVQSATWNASRPVPLSALFPTTTREIITENGIAVAVRRLASGRILFATLSRNDAAEVEQVTLTRREAVRRFIPWLDTKLKN